MSFFLLPEVQLCIAKSDVRAIILWRVFKIFPSFYIVSLCIAEQKRLNQIIKVVWNGSAGNFNAFDGLQGVCDFASIGKRTDWRTQVIRQFFEHIRKFYLISLNNIFEIHFQKQALKIAHFFCICFFRKDKRHTTVQSIFFISVRFISAYESIVFLEGDRVNPNLITSASKCSQNILRKHFGVASGNINIYITKSQKTI